MKKELKYQLYDLRTTAIRMNKDKIKKIMEDDYFRYTPFFRIEIFEDENFIISLQYNSYSRKNKNKFFIEFNDPKTCDLIDRSEIEMFLNRFKINNIYEYVMFRIL